MNAEDTRVEDTRAEAPALPTDEPLAADGPLTDDAALDAALRTLARTDDLGVAPYVPASRIGPYVLGERLGRGGMGVVYRAQDSRLARTVALKLLPAELARDPKRKALLLREARAAAAIDHANVTRVFDVGEPDGVAFLALELVDGVSLRAELERGPLDTDRALAVARQIAAGLAAAHAAGVVHRDLKPDNVVVDAHGNVKITDFGLARATATPNAREGGGGEGDPRFTLAGCGTRRYMPPEQATGEPVDERADVFAFGVLLVELLTAHTPTAGSDLARTKLPAFVRRLAVACLAVDPARRPRSGAALVAALAPRSLRRRPRVVAALAAAAIGLSLVAVWGRARAGAAKVDGVSVVPAVRVTTNSVEAPVLVAARSPDGTRIAYVERRGVFVRDTGSTRIVTTDEADDVAWMPDGASLLVVTRSGDVHLHTTRSPDAPPRSLGLEGVTAAAPSPRGGPIAIVRGQELSLVDLATGHERVLHRTPAMFLELEWAPDGRTIGVVTTTTRPRGAIEGAIVLVDVASGRANAVVEDPRLVQEVGAAGFTFRSDGAIVYALARTRDHDAELWETTIDRSSLRPRGAARALGRLPGTSTSHFSVSRDGAELSFVRYASQTDVYVADLDVATATLSPLRRLTLSEDSERPSDFTADGRLLVVIDTARGQRTVRLDPASGLGEPLVEGSPWTTWGAALDDGRAMVLALEETNANVTTNADANVNADEARVTIGLVAPDGTMTTGTSRGTTRIAGRGRPPPAGVALRCAPSACVLLEDGDDGLAISDVDRAGGHVTLRGKAREATAGWGGSLSRDGRRIAVRERSGRGWAIVDREGARLATVASLPCHAQFAQFTPTADALVTTEICPDRDRYQVRLHPLDGSPPKILHAAPHAWLGHPVVSRDGAHLALSVLPYESNVFTAPLP